MPEDIGEHCRTSGVRDHGNRSSIHPAWREEFRGGRNVEAAVPVAALHHGVDRRSGLPMLIMSRGCTGDCRMAALKDDVLGALAKVASPDGKPLPATGTLSDIVVTDGKVFFSITVDAGAVKRWERVRARAEAAVRAVPGVGSALVALTGERASAVGGSAPPRRPQMEASATRA